MRSRGRTVGRRALLPVLRGNRLLPARAERRPPNRVRSPSAGTPRRWRIRALTPAGSTDGSEQNSLLRQVSRRCRRPRISCNRRNPRATSLQRTRASGCAACCPAAEQLGRLAGGPCAYWPQCYPMTEEEPPPAAAGTPAASVIIPAHNEEQSIGRLLGKLTDEMAPGEFDMVVVCNGCTDRTASVAARFAPLVRVVEIARPSKHEAMREGDRASCTFPRVYVDADVELGTKDLRALVRTGSNTYTPARRAASLREPA